MEISKSERLLPEIKTFRLSLFKPLPIWCIFFALKFLTRSRRKCGLAHDGVANLFVGEYFFFALAIQTHNSQFKFGVVLMPVFVSVCFFLHILFKGTFEVNAGLIGQTNEHP